MEFVQVEASFERLRTRIPDMPISEILLSLLLLDSGRGIASMLEQRVRLFGLAEAQFRVLAALFSQPDGVAKLSELCAQTSQSASHISRLTEALVGRGLITRGPPSAPDRRKRILRTTEQGEELGRRFLPTLIGRARALFNDFSVDDQQQLITQLIRLSPKLDKALEQLVRG